MSYPQIPAAGTSVKTGTTVTLTISTGEGDTAARVPDVRGWAEEDAKSAISDAGLVPVVQTGSDQTVDVGEVYDQSVAAGTRVDSGTTVTIYVRSQDAAGETPADEGGTWKAEGQALGQPEATKAVKSKLSWSRQMTRGIPTLTSPWKWKIRSSRCLSAT